MRGKYEKDNDGNAGCHIYYDRYNQRYGRGEPENNDAQKKESVSDSVKVLQTSENTDEDRPKENSWRYSNGELIPQEDDATSNAEGCYKCMEKGQWTIC